MDTKSKLLEVAADLFAQYGYAGVSVRDIAAAMGFKESALYKHYKSKADILEHIILKAEQHIVTFYKEHESAHTDIKSATSCFYAETLRFYTQNDFMRNFRRIMNISQYESPEAQARYNDMFLNKTLNYYENIFTQVLQEGGRNDILARTMAVELYSVLYLLMQQYDSKVQDIDGAVFILERHIDNFFHTYSFMEDVK